MKFLTGIDENSNIMLLNILYFNERNFEKDDVLSIVFKDIDTGAKMVQNIRKPCIEVFVVKPEYRDRYKDLPPRDWYPKEVMMPLKVRYRNRYSQLAKYLGYENIEDVKNSGLVAFSNMDIVTYYEIMFQIEYGNDKPKPLNIGFLDIENDIIEIEHFPTPGECPIDMLNFIDEAGNTSYTLLLRPKHAANAIDPETGKHYDNRDQAAAFESDIENFVKELHEDFDETYGSIDYRFLFFDDELKLIQTLFRIIEACNTDFCQIWNLPYDIGNLVARPETLGAAPEDYICSNMFDEKEAYFKEDTNPIVHKRKHTIRIAHPCVFTDEMQNFSGIRVAKGKLPSLRLNDIGKMVMNDEKLNYEEDGNIRTVGYHNYRKKVKYLIKDTLLLLGIHRNTNDIADIYSRMYLNALTSSEAFVSTAMLTNSLAMYLYDVGYVVGNNRNKLKSASQAKTQYAMEQSALSDQNEFGSISDINPDDLVDVVQDDESETETDASKRKKQFDGALVMNPNRTRSTGFKVNGIENRKIHSHLYDMDLTSLYPSEMRFLNLSNETMIGRIEFIDDVYDYFAKRGELDRYISNGRCGANTVAMEEYRWNRLPMYNYTMIDDDSSRYHLNMSDVVLYEISENAIEEIGNQFCNLPLFEEIEKMYLSE